MDVTGFRASSELEWCKRFVPSTETTLPCYSMCRVLREGPVLCLNQCVFGVDMRSNVSAMCFLVGFVCALVFKVL